MWRRRLARRRQQHTRTLAALHDVMGAAYVQVRYARRMFLPDGRILVRRQMNDSVAFRWRPELREDVAGTFAYVARQRLMPTVREQFHYARPKEPRRTSHKNSQRPRSP